MNVIVDGIMFSRQPVGGVSTYFYEILTRLASQHSATIRLVLPVARTQAERLGIRGRALLGNALCRQGSIQAYYRPHWDTPWERDWPCEFDLFANESVFHSTYYTLLPTRKVAQVITVHDIFEISIPHLLYFEERERFIEHKRRCLAQADGIIAVSETTKTKLCEAYGVAPERVTVIHHGVNPFVFHPSLGDAWEAYVKRKYRLDRPYVLFVGARWPYKNFSRLAEAYARSKWGREVSLVVAGPPWDLQETELLRKLELLDRVHLACFASDPEMVSLYGLASAFVQPSLDEGFGLPLLEAMACGTPVAASRLEAFREVAGDAVCYFDPNDPDSISCAIERLLEPQVAGEYRRRGQERARHFSWDCAAQQTWDVYRRFSGRWP